MKAKTITTRLRNWRDGNLSLTMVWVTGCLVKKKIVHWKPRSCLNVIEAPNGLVETVFCLCRNSILMLCECCGKLHRYQVHLISYGCVSFLLIASGLIFTIFSVFQKDTQIGKVWLAGPTTMVVGLVLCGKVVIDWGPAMRQRSEYTQMPGTNAIASENSNGSSLPCNKRTSLTENNVLPNGNNTLNYDLIDSRQNIFHKKAPLSLAVALPTATAHNYCQNFARTRMSTSQLQQLERNFRGANGRLQQNVPNVTTHFNENICICDCPPNELSSPSNSFLRHSNEHVDCTSTVRCGSSDISRISSKPVARQQRKGAVYQGETFVLNNHSYLI